MILKSAQLSVPIIISRSGITQMGLELAQNLDLCCLGRALHQSFLCYSATHRLVMSLGLPSSDKP
jgi:FdhD protein